MVGVSGFTAAVGVPIHAVGVDVVAAPEGDALIVVQIHLQRHADLAEIVGADGDGGLLPGAAQGGEEHAQQQGDDADDDEQFDEGKSGSVILLVPLFVMWMRHGVILAAKIFVFLFGGLRLGLQRSIGELANCMLVG